MIEKMQTNALALDEINFLVEARHGWFLANQYDHYIGAALIRYGEFSEIEHRFLRTVVRAGDFVVEAGSNIGAHTIGLAKGVGTTGGVIAIEPQPAIFRVLCANIELNGLANVTPFALGCGERPENMLVPLYDYRRTTAHNSGSASLLRSGHGVPVSVVPLDDLLEHISRVRLLKVDVEGMERETLRGAARLIQEHRPFLYVENDRVDNSRALIDTIASMDYRIWWHTPPLFNSENYFGVRENAYPNVVSFNLFCQPMGADPVVHPELHELVDASEHPLRR
ncbi:MAG TPA: FkbM family methyltransferase [Burkholderiales bacterium]|nr:FkbM family methyltransferase [Burkholderiales bacterium]